MGRCLKVNYQQFSLTRCCYSWRAFKGAQNMNSNSQMGISLRGMRGISCEGFLGSRNSGLPLPLLRTGTNVTMSDIIKIQIMYLTCLTKWECLTIIYCNMCIKKCHFHCDMKTISQASPCSFFLKPKEKGGLSAIQYFEHQIIVTLVHIINYWVTQKCREKKRKHFDLQTKGMTRKGK